jgi:hypothetical protein
LIRLDTLDTHQRNNFVFADIDGNPLDKLEVLVDRDNIRLIMKDGRAWKNTLVPPAHPEYTPSEKKHTPTGTL